jgi:mRNA-capping enzyme
MLDSRYMMLIDGVNEVYMLDRDNAVYRVPNVVFPKRKDPARHLSNTLLDGVSLPSLSRFFHSYLL